MVLLISGCSGDDEKVVTLPVGIKNVQRCFDYDITKVFARNDPRYSVLSDDQAKKICESLGIKKRRKKYIVVTRAEEVTFDGRGGISVEKQSEGAVLVIVNKDVKVFEGPPYDFTRVFKPTK